MNGVDTYLVTGTIYQFRFRAVNALGNSDYSSYLYVALTDSPAAPSTITRVDSSSSKTSIAVDWSAVSDGTSPGGLITGYKLYMANGSAGTYYLVYDGSNLPTITAYIISGLTTGEIYRFKVSALNYNGEGLLSSELSTYACIAPSNFIQPYKISSTSTTMTLGWVEPTENGGCTITGYAVFRDDGAGSSITTEVNSANDGSIRTRPSLRSATITYFPASPTGLTF